MNEHGDWLAMSALEKTEVWTSVIAIFHFCAGIICYPVVAFWIKFFKEIPRELPEMLVWLKIYKKLNDNCVENWYKILEIYVKLLRSFEDSYSFYKCVGQ